MLRKLFWEDPYLTECEAIITKVDNNIVQVNQTIAYAYSGGQESDSGTIADFEIISAKKNGFDIDYELANHNLKVGDPVAIKIDWEKRYKIMRLHFCGDLVLQIILTKYPDIYRIGAHVSESKVRMDFNFDDNISIMFDWLSQELESIIEAGLPITKGFVNEGMQRRFWRIDGYPDAQCGGTHINSTKELNKIRFKRKNLGAKKERIEMTLE